MSRQPCRPRSPGLSRAMLLAAAALFAVTLPACTITEQTREEDYLGDETGHDPVPDFRHREPDPVPADDDDRPAYRPGLRLASAR